jgi:hypothetical protein
MIKSKSGMMSTETELHMLVTLYIRGLSSCELPCILKRVKRETYKNQYFDVKLDLFMHFHVVVNNTKTE